MHLRDLLLADEHTVGRVADVCRPVLHLPGCKPALAALTEMRRENLQIAIVVDEPCLSVGGGGAFSMSGCETGLGNLDLVM
ncbi:hypothetical protein R4P64_30290 [Rhodococcus sp. IEGM 1366]|nr:hypothetical protein [Rhodococcus sp. IEGM 1366]MDV8070818.1 hypothetical protein [Rhodococcus sp. IEGM 1366]